MARVSRYIVLLKNIWPSRRNSFHPRLHYTRQNVHVHFFSDRFFIFKEMRWHDITFTGHNTQHVNIGTWTFCSGNNGDIFGVVGEPAIIPPVDLGYPKKTELFPW